MMCDDIHHMNNYVCANALEVLSFPVSTSIICLCWPYKSLATMTTWDLQLKKGITHSTANRDRIYMFRLDFSFPFLVEAEYSVI